MLEKQYMVVDEQKEDRRSVFVIPEAMGILIQSNNSHVE